MQEKVLMKGNEAIAEAAILAGCRHYLGYPITPQTEVAAYMAKKMPKIGGTFLQAESEIAAINMVYGVAATGKRAMTSSSSPGIALKCEGISYLAGADLPAVIVNVQRGGRPRRHSAIAVRLLPRDARTWPRRLPCAGTGSGVGSGDGRPDRKGV